MPARKRPPAGATPSDLLEFEMHGYRVRLTADGRVSQVDGPTPERPAESPQQDAAGGG